MAAPAAASATPSPGTFPPGYDRDELARSSPTRLLPNLRTDGFRQGRLGMYMNHAPLTGSGCPTVTDGLDRSEESNILLRRVGGGYPHFHWHTGGQKPKLSDPALSAWEASAAVHRLPAESLTCDTVGHLSVSDRESPQWLILSGTQRARLEQCTSWLHREPLPCQRRSRSGQPQIQDAGADPVLGQPLRHPQRHRKPLPMVSSVRSEPSP
jgi:hypothetical protein